MNNAPDIMALAKARWPSILMHCGVDERAVSGKHAPCPICGGKDRFRMIDTSSDARWVCNQCGSGDGMDLLMAFTKQDFKQAANTIRPIVGSCAFASYPIKMTKEERKKRMGRNADLWKSGRKDHPLLVEYMASRGIIEAAWRDADLRVADDVPLYDEDRKLIGKYPAMLARVSTREGKMALIHRTYLMKEESGWKTTKKMTPGSREWKGGCIRMTDTRNQTKLIIAEGIETALSVRQMLYTKYGLLLPCWAAVSANAMENMAVPEHIQSLLIGADNDQNFTGQKAAYILANRVAVHDKKTAKVVVPTAAGSDWNDWLSSHQNTGGGSDAAVSGI